MGEKKSKIEDLKKQLKACKEKCEEYLNGWKRERADFLNYKKEEMERVQGLIKYANEEIILKMIPILDNFEIAEKNLPEELKNNEYVKGFLQIKLQILEFLKAHGVKEIKALGEIFDPTLHEAVEEVELSSIKSGKDKKMKPGMIIEEVKRGYKLYDKVIRPAKVKIIKQ